MNIIEAFLGLFKKDSDKKDEVIQEEQKMITYEQLLAINNNKNPEMCKYYIDALNKILPEYKINTKLRLCHFLAQILHESGNLKYKSENLNYSAKALRSVFPKYFKTDEIANQYARKPEKIANKVYANRMGNSDEASGDGWLFRGRGLIQLTGHDNYKLCGTSIKLNLLENPDLLINTAEASIKAACWFWSSKKLNELADQDDIKTVTKKINGGYNGIDDRCLILKRAKSVLM